MKIDLAIDRSVVLPVAYARAESLLTDIESTIRRFPNLKRLSPLGNDAWLWEMKTMGSRFAKIAHDVSYGARYTLDAERGVVRWVPVEGKGNAVIAGEFQLAEHAEGTVFSFRVRGTLHDVPVPLLYRPVAPTFIAAKFATLIERFLERTREALVSAPPVRTPRRS